MADNIELQEIRDNHRDFMTSANVAGRVSIMAAIEPDEGLQTAVLIYEEDPQTMNLVVMRGGSMRLLEEPQWVRGVIREALEMDTELPAA